MVEPGEFLYFRQEGTKCLWMSSFGDIAIDYAGEGLPTKYFGCKLCSLL